MKAATIQKLLQEGRMYITIYHEMVNEHRKLKREADERGDLETEYRAHNYVKYYRKKIAQRVTIQTELKKRLKEDK